MSLAATSIIGTLIPQNQNPETYFKAYGEFVYRLLSVLDIFDMYHAWWFQMLLVLLTVNIVVCSIDRLSSTWKIIFVKNAKIRPDRFRKRKGNHNFTDKRDAGSLEKDYKNAVSSFFSNSVVNKTDDGFHIYGEKGRLSRLGVYVVHVSVLFLLVGGLIGSFFGFEGYVNIAEGEATDTIRLRSSGAAQQLDFQIQCEDFSLQFYKNGAPKEYRSTLAIIDNGRATVKKDIIVNDPLRYKGINIFQSSYGKLPSAASKKPEPAVHDHSDGYDLKFLSKSSGMSYTLKAKIGEPVDIPEGLGKFVIMEKMETADFRGMNIGGALKGIHTPVGGAPQEILLPFKFLNFDKMRGGDFVVSITHEDHDSGNKPAVGDEQRYYTGLQVTKDPGVWVVYAGFMLMIAGCFITFFMSHQQVFVEVIQLKKNSRITVSGLSNRNRLSMDNKVEKIAKHLNNL